MSDDDIPVEYGPDGFLTDESSKRVAAMFDKDFPHGTLCDCKECLQREVARLRDALEEQGRYARRDRESAVQANTRHEYAKEALREAVDELADRQKFLSQVIKERDELFKERNKIARQAADLRDDLAAVKRDLAASKEKNSDLETEAWKREAEIDARNELLGAIWLYVKWHYVTKQLTTEQKTIWADAVDSFGDPEDRGPKAERWWEH